MEIIKSQKGFLTILTGKTDRGKSTISIYNASEQIKNDENVMLFSHEYAQSIIYNKLVAHFGLKWTQLYKINVVDSAGLALENVVELIKIKKDHVDAVYIDYLDLLKIATYPTKADDATDLERIQNIIRELAKLAKDLSIKIILLSQLGSESTVESSAGILQNFTAKVEDNNVIKMLISKGIGSESTIKFDDVSHILLIDGYDIQYYSTINFKEVYKD